MGFSNVHAGELYPNNNLNPILVTYSIKVELTFSNYYCCTMEQK